MATRGESGETDRGTGTSGTPGTGDTGQCHGQGQPALTVCPERRMTRGGRRDGAPSQTQIMKIMITMNEGVIILLLSRENMKGTLSQGRVKVSLQVVWIERM